mgnify:FL=1
MLAPVSIIASIPKRTIMAMNIQLSVNAEGMKTAKMYCISPIMENNAKSDTLKPSLIVALLARRHRKSERMIIPLDTATLNQS